MILTSENISKTLHDNAYLILARRGDDGNIHLGKIHPHETVTYTTPTTYNDTETLMYNLGSLERYDVAVVHEFPNRPTQRYKVRFGEVL